MCTLLSLQSGTKVASHQAERPGLELLLWGAAWLPGVSGVALIAACTRYEFMKLRYDSNVTLRSGTCCIQYDSSFTRCCACMSCWLCVLTACSPAASVALRTGGRRGKTDNTNKHHNYNNKQTQSSKLTTENNSRPARASWSPSPGACSLTWSRSPRNPRAEKSVKGTRHLTCDAS